MGVLGKYKLDWIFVKSYLEDPRNTGGPYAFAPHFARTMPRVNFALRELPFQTTIDDGGPSVRGTENR